MAKSQASLKIDIRNLRREAKGQAQLINVLTYACLTLHEKMDHYMERAEARDSALTEAHAAQGERIINALEMLKNECSLESLLPRVDMIAKAHTESLHRLHVKLDTALAKHKAFHEIFESTLITNFQQGLLPLTRQLEFIETAVSRKRARGDDDEDDEEDESEEDDGEGAK